MPPTPHVALLRGINVGGKNMLPMRELTPMFTACGFRNVQSYIQSGNVVFEAAADVTAKLLSRISNQIAEQYGFECPIVLRTQKELEEAIAHNPFLAGGMPDDQLYVYFLRESPKPGDVEKLDPTRSLPDEFAVRHREIYLCMRNGMGRTKLTNAYFDSKLKTISTARNWRTVLKLAEMMRTLSG